MQAPALTGGGFSADVPREPPRSPGGTTVVGLALEDRAAAEVSLARLDVARGG